MLEWSDPARREPWEEQGKQLRRGWHGGEPSFGERLAACLEKAGAGRRRSAPGGPARQAQEEPAAEGRLARGLQALGWTEDPLQQAAQGAAWWLRQHTTTRLGWIAERLEMGHESRVSQVVSRMGHRPGRRLNAPQSLLNGLEPAPSSR